MGSGLSPTFPTAWQREQLVRTITNPRCEAGDSTSSPLAGKGAGATKIATALATTARPMPSCTAFCMRLRKPNVLSRISHRRAVIGFIVARRERHARDWLDPDEVVTHALDAGDIFSGDD